MYLPRINAHDWTTPLVPVRKMTTRPIIVGAMAPRANGSILSKIGPISLTPYGFLCFHSLRLRTHQHQWLTVVTFTTLSFVLEGYPDALLRAARQDCPFLPHASLVRQTSPLRFTNASPWPVDD